MSKKNILSKESIEQLNKACQPYYLLVTMLVFFTGGFIAISKILFSPAELTVKVVTENINYPASINDNCLELFAAIQKEPADSTMTYNIGKIYQYLLNTKQQKIYEIINNTNKTMRAINIRETGVQDLTSWAVSSEYLLQEEKDRILKNLVYEKQSGIIYMKDALNLPPDATVKIYIWGDFTSYSPEESLIVTYDGGTGKLIKSKSFTGISAIIAEYWFLIAILVIATFALTYQLLINRYAPNKKNISESN